MSEFLGTKGRWKLSENDYGYFTSVRNLDDTRKVVVSRVNNQTESNANMLLISKAPEMLEMLNKCFDMCDKLQFPTEQELNTIKLEIKQVIKEATILNTPENIETE